MNGNERIKVIHYCWFGGNPLPDIVLRCMESWRKYCPDYEIREWNEENFDIHMNAYAEEAYAAKKWAFVSDLCRFWILYNYGGIYLDTDVELLKGIDGLPDTFVGFECSEHVNSGLIRGALPKDEICRLMLESYENDRFILEDGSLNIKTVCVRETELLKKSGLKTDGTRQLIAGTHIFPPDFFCPKNYYTGDLKITGNTYSIHHFDASWQPEKERYHCSLRSKLAKFLPMNIARLVARVITILKFDGFGSLVRKTVRIITGKQR